MADGSYTSSSGPFNPASYTRHFLGSPISWRASSFNAGSFTQRTAEQSFQGSIDANEMRYGRTPSSVAENRDSLLNALNLFDREGNSYVRLIPLFFFCSRAVLQCRNYTCCGLHLNDLHALLEHFEAVHIVLVNGDVQNPQMQIPFNPIANPVPASLPSESPAAFDPDDMELELDLDNTTACLAPPVTTAHSSPSSGAPSPPDTPISTPLSAWPSPHAFRSHHITPASSQPPSPRSKTAAPTRASSPVSASALRPNLSLNLGGASAFSRAHAPSPHILSNPEDAFNSYARFSQDYSSDLPGAQFNAAPADEASMVTNPPQNINWQQKGVQHQSGCVPPALLFSSSTTATPVSTPGGSRVPSPSGYAQAVAQAHAQQARQAQSSASMPTTPISSTPSRAPSLSRTSSNASPSLLLSKPFKCPKPNCNKSYKQANGLKYHMTHGSCNFAPPKDLEHVKDLLERKKRERERERERDLSLGRLVSSALTTPTTSGPATPTTELAAEYGITEMDLREVEREAERRLRPFACGVGDCQRRYKNMNGLRYHYQHSGEHGAQGLALLASGQHECLQGAKRGHHNSHNSQQQSQAHQPQNQYATVEDREGKKRLVIRPMVPQPQSHGQQVQVQEQRNNTKVGNGASVMVPVTVCDQQAQQQSPVPQQNTTQIHVTPIVVSPSVSQQGQQQQQQSTAVYAGQYSPSSQQPNPYAYACYTPPAASNNSVSQVSPSVHSNNSPVRQNPTPVASPTATNGYQQQAGYFGGASTAYLGMTGMSLGLGLTHGGASSLMGIQGGGYSQPTQAQLAAFHQQLKEQYRDYANQVQHQQQAQETKEGATT
ncbi:hypothetical protein D9756_010260 [Leucocoprinus leucothites]|uniref:C2H2-type domain-containing protein n=1 Tax=Leucocoprinus leucothites TaxID=201217 RepID=A0A8H5CTT8_9AGAR|nr:hypothetical protein D9756_010260 [Leucoagaricus leucothites]